MKRKKLTPNQKRSIRKNARKKIDILYTKQNGLCHWCKSYVAIEKNIDKENVVVVKRSYIIWKDMGFVFSARIATIDHVIPIGQGGTSDIDNLVVACATCNNDRTNKPKAPDKLKLLCPNCHSDKKPKKKFCQKCLIEKRTEWLIERGWNRVESHEPGEYKYVDPETKERHVLHAALALQGQRTKRVNENYRQKTGPHDNIARGKNIG